MKTVFKTYGPSKDLMIIRDFIVDTFSLYQGPFNWTITRWNFCRYFVVPFHTFYNVRYFGVPTHPGYGHRDGLPAPKFPDGFMIKRVLNEEV